MSDHVRICGMERCAYCRLDVSPGYGLLQRDVRDAFFARQIRELDAQAAPPGEVYVRGIKGERLTKTYAHATQTCNRISTSCSSVARKGPAGGARKEPSKCDQTI